MAESRDPGLIIPGEIIPNREAELDRMMDEDLNAVCSTLEQANVEKTAANIHQHQTPDQHMQYGQREIGRWLRGVK